MIELLDELQELDIDLKVLIDNATAKVEELFRAGFSKEAEVVVKQLLVVDPNNIQGLQLYGLILYREKKYQEAVDLLNKAIALDASNAENHNNIALCYLHAGKFTEALESITYAIEINPNNHNFVNNMGLIYRSLGELDKSIEVFKKAIDLQPTDSKGWENLGSAYGQNKELEKGIDCFKKAIELDPKSLGPHIDLAYGYHLLGEWEKAWPEYEYRLEYWHAAGRNPGRFYDIYKPEKNWDGKKSLKDKKVIVYCEQGTGDLIQFVRFVPKLKELGATVYLDSPASLVTLIKDFGIIRTNYNDEILYDYHCSILSLPYLLNLTTPDKFLSGPYLFADKLDMNDYKNTFNIGICWAGNPGHPNDANRSCYLSLFREIYNLPNVKLFSLQKDVGKRVYTNRPDVELDLASNCDDMKIVDTCDLMVDYQATSMIINSLDLVITVDTSVLHLSGALGKETWALLPFNPDWRWTISGDKTAWYDNMTLFRQTKIGDWKSVFDQILIKLKNKLS